MSLLPSKRHHKLTFLNFLSFIHLEKGVYAYSSIHREVIFFYDDVQCSNSNQNRMIRLASPVTNCLTGLFGWILGIEFRASHLRGKKSTNSAISHAPHRRSEVELEEVVVIDIFSRICLCSPPIEKQIANIYIRTGSRSTRHKLHWAQPVSQAFLSECERKSSHAETWFLQLILSKALNLPKRFTGSPLQRSKCKVILSSGEKTHVP